MLALATVLQSSMRGLDPRSAIREHRQENCPLI
jgi:hypothetical protein